jgi:hypothetical protein
MLRVVVEGVEVVVDEVDLGSLRDAEPEAQEDVLDLAPRGRQQVQPAERRDRRAGQRDVERVGEPGLELMGPDAVGAVGDQLLEPLPRLVGGLADRAALGGRQLTHPPQQVGELGLAAEMLDARGLEGLSRVGILDRRRGGGTKLGDPVKHRAGPYSSRRARPSPPSRR